MSHIKYELIILLKKRSSLEIHILPFSKMIFGFLIFCFGLVTSQDYMTSDMTPDLGPDMDTVYQPGSPGGPLEPS